MIDIARRLRSRIGPAAEEQGKDPGAQVAIRNRPRLGGSCSNGGKSLGRMASF